MKAFSELFSTLDETSKTKLKISALSDYFKAADSMDRLWAVGLFTGRRPKRAVTTTQLRQWAAERAGIPLWLFEECDPVVGDLAETLALILPPAQSAHDRSLSEWIIWLQALHQISPEMRKPLGISYLCRSVFCSIS